MSQPPAQPEFSPTAGIDTAAAARRAMAILCIVYLVLGLADAGHFISSRMPGLEEARVTAEAEVASLTRLEPGVLEEARRVAAGTEARRDELSPPAAPEKDTESGAEPAAEAEAEAKEEESPPPVEPSVRQAAGVDAAAAKAHLSDLERQQAACDAADTTLAAAETAVRRGWARAGGFAVGFLILGFFLSYRSRLRTEAQVTNAITLMILLLGLVLLASRLTVQAALPNYVAWGIADLVALHVVLCLIMPITPRESALPFLLLILVWAVTFVVPGASDLAILDRVVIIIMSPVLLLPGIGVVRWRERHREEQDERRVLVGQVESFGGELSRARIVHDAMFPPPFTGHVRFEYEYRPIHEIGGDYVHTYVCPNTGRVTLTLLDVAGHGLAAALTVNRLFGELERILAENAAATPSEITALLNRYIYLTMSHHSLFATGTCMMLDPCDGRLEWVSAGHPPSLLRRSDGRVEDLETTSIILGVLEPDEYDPGTQQITMNPGDAVIAYTDGAFEARDRAGRPFGLERVRQTASFDPPPRSWPKFIAGAVTKHHDGRAEDDVLIAALTLASLRVPEADHLSVAVRTAQASTR